MTKRFVDSFRTLSYPRKILVICDDGSTDGTGEFLSQQPDVITVAWRWIAVVVRRHKCRHHGKPSSTSPIMC